MSNLVLASRLPKGTSRSVLIVLAGISILPALASAPTAEPVIRVEEDWELVVNEPNDGTQSPQFHTVMSPDGTVDGYFAQTLWNYRETPDFAAGGVQLQSYNGEELLRTRSVEHRPLSTTAETITWTQSLETDGTTLTFSVANGVSTTWGEFGRDMNISSTANLPELNQYSADASAADSCVTYGANRVESLTLVRVRYYSADGLLAVDNTPRPACE